MVRSQEGERVEKTISGAENSEALPDGILAETTTIR